MTPSSGTLLELLSRDHNKGFRSGRRRYLKRVNRKWKADMHLYGVTEQDYEDDNGNYSYPRIHSSILIILL